MGQIAEFDKYICNVNEMISKQEKFAIYGAGVLGEKLCYCLKKCDVFAFFVDNDLNKQQAGYIGELVYSERKYLEAQEATKIIIAASQKNTKDIRRNLLNIGLTEGVDFWTYTEFMERIFPAVFYLKFGEIFVSLAQICLTERCTLKCRKCAHACYAVKADKGDLSLQQVYHSADCFFEHVNYIQEFVLIGGEPLLYKDLDKAIIYIGEHYRDKIHIFSITTNGTILPSERILELCKKYNVLFRISNYSEAIPRLEQRYKAITSLLDRENISYSLGEKEHQWMDYGFEYVNRQASASELIKVFDDCHTPCHEIRENRFYYCVMARSVSENLGMNVGKEDYLNMDDLQGEEGKRKLLAYSLGYSEKGYLDMCNFCHGAESIHYPIPAAEQL